MMADEVRGDDGVVERRQHAGQYKLRRCTCSGSTRAAARPWRGSPTPQGHVVGEGRGGGANLHNAGELGTEKVLYEVIEAAVGADAPLPGVVCVGMAGMDRADDREVVARDPAPARFPRPGARRERRAGRAGRRRRRGARCRRRRRHRVDRLRRRRPAASPRGPAAGARSTATKGRRSGSAGWRWPRWCAPAIGRGPQTALTPLVLRHAGTDRIDGLVAQVYARPDRRQAIAAMAGLVARADADGDAVARRDPVARRPTS